MDPLHPFLLYYMKIKQKTTLVSLYPLFRNTHIKKEDPKLKNKQKPSLIVM